MDDGDDTGSVSRRRLLGASAGVVGTSLGAGTGSATVDEDEGAAGRSLDRFDRRCPDATLEPSTGHCVEGGMEGCADDHPVTVELQSAVRESLAEHYPDVGALIDAGFKPYFDALEREDDSYSHWINPTYVGDDTILDPRRPESILVDDETWRAIGVMFVATRDGERVEPPPALYGESVRIADSDGGTVDGDWADEVDAAAVGADDDLCSPWHYHAGLPGRFAWWYYQQVYERDFIERSIRLPCRTPCLLHVWAVDHPESVYAHHAPPPEYRDVAPADEAGFETDAEPGTDDLGWDVLPEELEPEYRPDELAALVPGL